jgi:hypothetical protein
MSIPRKISTWVILATMVALLAMSWISVALAQTESDGDGLDGDELGLPIIIGVGILAYVGWQAVRRRSRKLP